MYICTQMGCRGETRLDMTTREEATAGHREDAKSRDSCIGTAMLKYFTKTPHYRKVRLRQEPTTSLYGSCLAPPHASPISFPRAPCLKILVHFPPDYMHLLTYSLNRP